MGGYRPITFWWSGSGRIGARAAKHRLDEPARLSLEWLHSCSACFCFTWRSNCSSASGSLKCKRHRFEIEGPFTCLLLQEVYAEIPLKKPAGFRRVHEQDICQG